MSYKGLMCMYQIILFLTCGKSQFCSTYTNDIVRRDPVQDPEQKSWMRRDEHYNAWHPAERLRHKLQQQSDNWLEAYVDAMKDHLDRVLEHVHTLRTQRRLHYFRRIIAFYHQEIDLRSQGDDVWDAAHADGALVMAGRG
jgi:hypothetical protein